MPDFSPVPFEAEMNQAEIQALIDASLRRDLIYSFPFSTIPTAGQVSASTWTNVCAVPALEIIQTTPGANKIAEYVPVRQLTDAFWETTYASFNERKIKIRSFVGPYQTTNATATSFSGIEHGSFGSTTPFAASPAQGVIQLRHQRAADIFELVVAIGDGSAASVTTLTGTPTLGVHGCMMELVIDYPNNLVQAFINDAIGAAVSADLGAFSIGPTSNGIYPFGGLFTTSGSDASASAQCYFSNFEFEISNYKTG